MWTLILNPITEMPLYEQQVEREALVVERLVTELNRIMEDNMTIYITTPHRVQRVSINNKFKGICVY